jgi:hypothetical protein
MRSPEQMVKGEPGTCLANEEKHALYHGVCFLCHCSNRLFRNSMLVMCADARKLQFLVGFGE